MQNKTVFFDKFGTAAELYVKEIPLPPINDNELLIKTAAAALNPIDAKIRNGSSFVCKNRKDPFPWTLGFDFAGTVESGSKNNEFKAGDKVAGIAGHPFNPCAYAQYIKTSDKLICKVPENVSLKEAAALPTAGITALDILNTLKEIKDKLIHKLTYRDNFRLLMLQGEKEKAFIYAKNELTERLERLFMTYPKYETFMGQSRKIIDKYNKMAESTGFQLPEHLQNAEKYIEYRKYIISIAQQD